jgi:hypothetical protein
VLADLLVASLGYGAQLPLGCISAECMAFSRHVWLDNAPAIMLVTVEACLAPIAAKMAPMGQQSGLRYLPDTRRFTCAQLQELLRYLLQAMPADVSSRSSTLPALLD